MENARQGLGNLLLGELGLGELAGGPSMGGGGGNRAGGLFSALGGGGPSIGLLGESTFKFCFLVADAS